jgi:hypothetical protein
MLKNIKEFGIVAAITSTSFLIPSSVYAFGLVYDVNQFDNVQGLSGVATSAAPINNAAFVGGNGFANPTALFTEDFLLLGALATNTNIPTDSLKNNNSVAQSIQLVNLTAGDIINGIGLSFRFGYNGNSSGVANNDRDNFAISLINTSGAANGFGDFISVNAPTYSTANSISTILTSQVALQPGNYALLISVNENADVFGRSTAAGFNNIAISPIPFEFNPAVGVGLLGLACGTNMLKKAKKAVKK